VEQEAEAEEVEGEEVEDHEKEEEIQLTEGQTEQKKEKKKANKNLASLKRRKSLYEGFDETQELFRPEYRFANDDPVKEKMWELMDTYLPRDKLNIQKSIVKHIQTLQYYLLILTMLLKVVLENNSNNIFYSLYKKMASQIISSQPKR